MAYFDEKNIGHPKYLLLSSIARDVSWDFEWMVWGHI